MQLENFFKKNIFIFIGIIIFFVPFFWFSNNEIVSGGEMFAIIKPTITFDLVSHTWQSSSLGLPSIYIISYLYQVLNYILALFFSTPVIMKIIFGLFLAGPYFSFYYFIKVLFKNVRTITAITSSLFYVFNPFYVMMFGWLPTYGSLFILFPFFFISIIKIFNEEIGAKNCLILILSSFLMSIVGLNLALLGLFFAIAFIYYFYAVLSRVNTFLCLSKKLLIILSIILLTNSFWILPIYSYQGDLFGNAKINTSIFSADSLFKSPILNGLALNQYFWFDKEDASHNLYYSYSSWYQLPSKVFILVFIIATAFILIIKHWYLFKKYKKNLGPLFLFFLILTLLGVFLSKGTAKPFGFFYKYILDNIKILGIYRASDVKFPFFVVFGLSFFIFIFLNIFNNRRILKYITIIFLSIIFFLGTPFILGKIFEKSSKASIPDYWQNYSLNSNLLKLDSRTLLFPKNFSPFDNYEWGYLGSWLPNNISNKNNVGYFESYGSSIQENLFSLPKATYYNFENDNSRAMMNSMAIFNIKNILQRNDFDLIKNSNDASSYDKNGLILYDSERIKNFFSKNSYYFNQDKEYGKIINYKINDNFFLPHFYIPKKIIPSKRSVDYLSTILSQKDLDISSAIFFANQNANKPDLLKFLENEKTTATKPPILEFKKINPTKYRLRIHQASGKFPLIFSESFQDKWKIYLTNTIHGVNNAKGALNEYKILAGNDGDQATSEELKNFVDKGWVSEIGDLREKEIKHLKWNDSKQREDLDYKEKYKIDFISKNFQDTIQNDNLPNGNIFETWLKKPIENNGNHLLANGYANSWLIDTDKICGQNYEIATASPRNKKVICIKNSDGTYDFEIVVEFWPQRLFYIGFFISGITLLACFGYLGYSFYKKKYAAKN